MKRSEMLKKIELRTKNTDLADIILMDLEMFGMLPPERKLGLKDAETLRAWSVTDQVNAYYTWEPENE